jgi:hypothetical protein
MLRVKGKWNKERLVVVVKEAIAVLVALQRSTPQELQTSLFDSPLIDN